MNDIQEESCTCGFAFHPNLPCGEIAQFHNHVDSEYFRLLNLILNNGKRKKNRTGIDTIGIFGAQAKFQVDLDAFPILTTKKVWFKGILHELLWFIKGDTNIKYLVDNDVHIWDEWAWTRYKKLHYNNDSIDDDKWMRHNGDGSVGLFTLEDFVDKIKSDNEFAEKWGELGEGTYGGMWRDFPHFKKTYDAKMCGVGDEYERDGVDQLQKVIDKLKTNPDDRRMIVSAWHPYWVDHCALPPCHCLFHFNTEELTLDERELMYTKKHHDGYECNYPIGYIDGDAELQSSLLDKDNIPKRKLNLLLYQRSCDAGLGVPYNITSYCLLLAMVSQCVNMIPGIFTHTYGDLHIYDNHIDPLKEQLTRTPKKLPKLWLNPDVKDIFSFKYDDIKLIDYQSHSSIKMDIAV